MSCSALRGRMTWGCSQAIGRVIPRRSKRWNSTDYTVAHAGALLADCGFPAAKSAAAVECIRTHEAHGDPTTIEGIILRDADLLEQLGAVAVMRTVAKIAQDTRFITFADAAGALRRALNISAFQD